MRQKANRRACRGGQGRLSGPVNGLEKLLFLQPILLEKQVLASTQAGQRVNHRHYALKSKGI
jgi:hypothetical protein